MLDLADGHDSNDEPEATTKFGRMTATIHKLCLQRKIDLVLTSSALHCWVSDFCGNELVDTRADLRALKKH